MVKINRKVEYALIALQYMRFQPEGHWVSAKELYELYHMSFEVLAKVLQNLVTSGILSSIKGVNGGYQISCVLSEVTFLELDEAVTGVGQFSRCINATKKGCNLSKSCNIITPVQYLSNRIKDLFGSMKISELLEVKDVEVNKKGLKSLHFREAIR